MKNATTLKNFLEDIVVPTTILCSLDDPFVEPTIFKSVRMSSAIELNTPGNGGHMGYLSKKPTPWGDYRWMDFMVVDWVNDYGEAGVTDMTNWSGGLWPAGLN